MSGIGSVGGQYGRTSWSLGSINDSQTSAAGQSTDAFDVSESNATEATLDSVLNASGMDDETQDRFKTDLTDALSKLFAGGSMPSIDEIMSTIEGVFQKYGLDTDKIFGQKTSSDTSSGTSSDTSSDTSLDSLFSALEKEDEAGTTFFDYVLAQVKAEAQKTSSELESDFIAKEMAQRVADLQFGFDAEA